MIEPLGIEKYCDSLKDKIVFNHFSTSEFIDGAGIKNLSDVPQVNSFVIRELFKEWQRETAKLKSPFFDFEHDDVKDALDTFMGVLSYHIKIDKDRFDYLLKDALKATFEYLESPIYFLQEEVFNFSGSIISKEEVKKRFRYLKLYPDQVKELKEDSRLQEDNIRLDQIMTAIEDVFEHADLESTEKDLIEELEKIVPNNFVSFVNEAPFIPLSVEEDSENELDSISKDLEVEDNNDLEEESSVDNEEALSSKKKVTLADSFEQKNTDEFSVELSPIESLEEGISLHQKYYFIKELFEGNSNSYEKAIKDADRFGSFDDASDYLLETYAGTYSWEGKEEAVTDLFTLLTRKF